MGINVTGDNNAVASSAGGGSATASTNVPPSPHLTGELEKIHKMLALLAKLQASVWENLGAGTAQLPPERAAIIIKEAKKLEAQVRRGRLRDKSIRLALRKLTTAATPVVSLLAQANEVKDLVTKLLH